MQSNIKLFVEKVKFQVNTTKNNLTTMSSYKRNCTQAQFLLRVLKVVISVALLKEE